MFPKKICHLVSGIIAVGVCLARLQAETGSTLAFAHDDEVTKVFDLNNIVGADRFYQEGFYGQNTTSWVVDAGFAYGSHDSLTNLAYQYRSDDAINRPDGHATAVAMLLGGRPDADANGNYLSIWVGLAPFTTLGSAALATSTGTNGTFSASEQSIYSAYKHAALNGDVVSTSLGFGSDAKGVTNVTGLLDSLALASTKTTIVVSAGNSGPSSGTVSSPASGYNSISVGALTNASTYDTIASFSSRGPQTAGWYDGTVAHTASSGTIRPVVDIVAPGTNLVSAAYETDANGQSIGTNYYYYAMEGTSFAAPLVAGGASLLVSTAKSALEFAGVVDAATQSVVIKSVLMNSADKLAGWDNGQQLVDGVITTNQALDYTTGAGRLNLAKAFDQYVTGTRDVVTASSDFNALVDATGWDFGSVAFGADNSYYLDQELLAGQQIAITLSWMRDRIWSDEDMDFSDLRQAQLDLFVYRILAGGDQLVAQSISPVSTTQELFFTLAEGGNYRFEVDWSQNLFDLSQTLPGTQNYGVAWSVGIPEPGTALLLAVGAVFVFFRRYIRRTEPAKAHGIQA